MQAIRTKYHGPGNVRGSGFTVTSAAKTMRVGYDHRLNVEDNHQAAARAMILALKWDDAKHYQGFVSGCLKDGSYVHVLVHALSEVAK